MTQSPEILPVEQCDREALSCPWCGLEWQGHFQWPGGAWSRYTVPDRHREGCPMRGDSYPTEEALLTAWNTRTIPDDTRALVKDLVEALEAIDAPWFGSDFAISEIRSIAGAARFRALRYLEQQK